MSNTKIYRHYAYLAGIQVPIISDVISSNYGSLASLNVSIHYSPFITRIHEYTKIQVWEQAVINGNLEEPTLEFDGIVVGVQRSRNILGEVSVNLSCLTDGAIWNIRKQADFYLQDITTADYRGTGDLQNMRADGQITNFFTDILNQNKFDIGCSIASILTSYIKYEKNPNEQSIEDAINQKPDVATSYYTYQFNGKRYSNKVLPSGSGNDNDANPIYYNRFLSDFKLASKVYGVSTSDIFKNYFKDDEFTNLITNTQNDIYGENTFWELGVKVGRYGFFNIYDVPNPTFIDVDTQGNDLINVQSLLPNDIATKINTDGTTVQIPTQQSTTTLLSKKENTTSKYNRSYKGLAEYIIKPISVMGIPFECNLIWPDQVIEESIFYDFFNTPTRILYQRSPIPGIEKNILTTKIIVGPDFQSSGYLTSMTIQNRKSGTLRSADVYTDYELEYGIKYSRLNLSYAFDNALLKAFTDKANNVQLENSIDKINNYLNYEFAQKFLGSRQYTVQVTPDCNPVAGFPVVILNKMGEHVIAFCTGVRKAWSATGQKTVSLSVSYPRYYFEDFGDLGNVIDTISQDPIALQEISKLIGSSALDGINTASKTSQDLRNSITQYFSSFQDTNSDVLDNFKNNYKRSSCTYQQFMSLYSITINNTDKTNMPNQYLLDIFKSSDNANNLSCHYFEVYDNINKAVTPYGAGTTLQQIIKSHLDWISNSQRI